MNPDDKPYQLALKRGERAFTRRDSRWRTVWETAWSVIMPERQFFYTETTGDYYKNVYDSTAIDGADSLANTLVSGLTPPWVPFIVLAPGPDVTDAKERDALRKSLEFVNRRLFLHINLSNFVQEVQPAFLDSVVSTGIIKIEPKSDGVGLTFSNIPLDQVAFEEKAGMPAYFYHQRRERKSWVLEKHSDKLDKQMVKDYEERPDEEVPIWCTVEPINNSSKSQYFLVLKHDNGILLDEREIDRDPFIAFRWSKIPNSPYGRGPALKATPDTRYLNRTKELFLKNLELAIAGIYTAIDDGVINPYALKLAPGAIIPVASNSSDNPGLRKLDIAADLNAGNLGIELLRGDVKRMFYADRFSNIEGSKLTATEVMMRSKIIAQNLGATYGRFQTELLYPLIAKTIDILISQGQLPEAVRPNEKTIKVEFLSSLAQAQRLQEVDALLQWTAYVAQVSQLDPTCGTTLNGGALLRKIGELMQIDPGVIHSEDEAQAIVDKGMQGQQQMAAQAAAMSAAGGTNEQGQLPAGAAPLGG